MKSKSVLHSFFYAFSGMWYAVKTQRNIRIHSIIALCVVALGLWLGLGWLQWAVLFLMMGAVVSSEMLNTAIETIVDAQVEEFHPLAKVAKDVSAGAVMILALTAVLVGICLLGPPLLDKLGVVLR
jgi:diacylglycerol kinase